MLERLRRQSYKNIPPLLSDEHYEQAVMNLSDFLTEDISPVFSLEDLQNQMVWIGTDLRYIIYEYGIQESMGILDQKKVMAITANFYGRSVKAWTRKGIVSISESQGKNKIYTVTLPSQLATAKKQLKRLMNPKKTPFTSIDYRRDFVTKLYLTKSCDLSEFQFYISNVKEAITGVFWAINTVSDE